MKKEFEMAKKQGWEKGLGKYSKPVKVTNGPGDNPNAPTRDLSKAVFGEDYPVRGRAFEREQEISKIKP